MQKRLRAALYCREYQSAGHLGPEGLRILKSDPKFSDLHRLAGKIDGKADLVLVAAPEVLGDTYEELVMNLVVLAHHGLLVGIVPPGQAKGEQFFKVREE